MHDMSHDSQDLISLRHLMSFPDRPSFAQGRCPSMSTVVTASGAGEGGEARFSSGWLYQKGLDGPADLLVHRHAFAFVALQERLYIFGGYLQRTLGTWQTLPAETVLQRVFSCDASLFSRDDGPSDSWGSGEGGGATMGPPNPGAVVTGGRPRAMVVEDLMPRRR